jgi:hypothetical protein
MKELHPLDIRNYSKEEACRLLWRAEMTYLGARGWITLCGIPDKYYVAPGDDYKDDKTILYSHEEALKIQKEKDNE